VKVNDHDDFIVRRPFGADSLQYIHESKGEKKQREEDEHKEDGEANKRIKK
jgi:hypothetical protein